MAEGLHAFSVRATDPLGNVDPTPANRNFLLDSTPPDTTPPETFITNAIKKRLRTTNESKKVKVSFQSEAGATFECRLDGDEFAPCLSPFRPKAEAAPGKGKKHKVEVRATDAAGNVEGTPARAKFRLIQID